MTCEDGTTCGQKRRKFPVKQKYVTVLGLLLLVLLDTVKQGNTMLDDAVNDRPCSLQRDMVMDLPWSQGRWIKSRACRNKRKGMT